MKANCTLTKLQAYLAERPVRACDVVPLDRPATGLLDREVPGGQTVVVPELTEEEQDIADAALEEAVLCTARTDGWVAAAKYFIAAQGLPPLTGLRLAGFAAAMQRTSL